MANKWGLTESGFYCPTYDEVLDDNIKLAKKYFGEDISVNELTAFGKYLRIIASGDHKVYETAEELYYSVSPATATGVSLERVAGSFIGENKNPAVCAMHAVRLYGTQGAIIKAGATLVRNSAGVIFYPVTDAVIGLEETTQDGISYYADVIVQCSVAGVAGNTSGINSTVNVNSDITGVSYLYQVTEGKGTETDAEYRARYEKIVQGLGTNTEAAIIAEVLKIDGVHACIIKKNFNSEADIEISPKFILKNGTYAVIVHADNGLRNEVAQAIFKKMPFGIHQSGLETVAVKDDADESHNVKFTFVEEKRLDVSIKCTVSDNFERDGTEKIRDNIKSYMDNLAIGKMLVYSKLYEKIHSVTGVEDVLDLTVNGGKENISVSSTEIIKCGVIDIQTTEV